MSGGDGSSNNALYLLCLHGMRQCSEVLSQRLERLQKRFRTLSPPIHLVFAEGGYEMPLEDGQAVPMRAWWDRSTGRGWTESRMAIQQAVSAVPRIDGVLGFSQGVAVAAMLCLERQLFMQQQQQQQQQQPDGLRPLLPDLAFAILIGGQATSATLPRGEPLATALLACDSGSIALPSLHFMGATDKIVPVAASADLAAKFAAAQTVVHKQGHSIPQQRVHIAEMEAFALRCCAARIGGCGGAVVKQPAADLDDEAYDGAVNDEDEDSHHTNTSKAKTLPSAPATQQGRPAVVAVAVAEAYGPTPEQQEEITSLSDIFADDFSQLSTQPPKFSVRCGEEGSTACIIFTLPKDYPASPPLVQASGLGALLKLSRSDETRWHRAWADSVAAQAAPLLGSEMLFQLVGAAREWLADALAGTITLPPDGGATASTPASAASAQPSAAPSAAAAAAAADASGPSALAMRGQEDPEGVDHAALVLLASAEAARADSSLPRFVDVTARGQWRYVIGLVGKPSAGKSTFFNAASDPADAKLEARVAAFPFTTILPNVGRGYYSAPCPFQRYGLARSAADDGSGNNTSDAAHGCELPLLV